MKKIMSTAELKVFWDTYEKNYTKNVNYNLHSVYVSMCSILDIMNKSSVLELSCGPGSGLNYLTQILNRGKKIDIYGTDLSPNMLNTSYEVLSKNKNISLRKGDKYVDNKSEVELNLLECNNEDLKVFKDKQFDSVLSNFSLHLVENPEKMLQESSRVLKDDGVACFSVWGRPENCPLFTIIPNTLKKFEVSLPEVRSFFHISKIEKLKPLILNNGFKKLNYCYTFTPHNISKPEDYYYMIDSPLYAQIFDNLDKATKDEIISDICQQIDGILNKDNQLLGTETLIVRCAKH